MNLNLTQMVKSNWLPSNSGNGLGQGHSLEVKLMRMIHKSTLNKLTMK